jgi:hypothetical protein
LASVRDDLFAAREPIGVARVEARAERAGIHRERRMQMRVAEEWPHGEVPVGIG